MKKRRGGFCTILLAAACAALTGCGAAEISAPEVDEVVSDNIVVGFTQVGAESDWRVANTESMKTTFTEENGYELLFHEAKQKQENQIEALRNYILQDVDYIVLPPIVESGWDEVLAEAKNADIPVIIMDRMIETQDDSLYAAWVGSDTYWEGETAAGWLSDYLEEQGRSGEEIAILHVQGTLGSTPQLGRTAGLMKGLEEHRNWKLIAQVEGEFTQAKAYAEVSEVLKTTKDVDVIYCENDNSAFGAIQALEEAGLTYGADGEVIIIAFDATTAGLTACLEGKINLDVECNPLHGPRVEEIIRTLESGGTPEKMCYVEEQYFTPDTLTKEQLEARLY